MKDHYVKEQNRTRKSYKPNEDKKIKILTEEIDLIKNNYIMSN